MLTSQAIRRIGVFISGTLTAIFILFLGTLIVYGGWLDPMTPTNQNVQPTLDVGPGGQSKSGGLILNSSSSASANYGLIIYDNPSNPVGTGRVGIGNNVPRAKLDIIGNLGVSGLIKPNGSAGQIGDLLESSGFGMRWAGRTAWATLTGAPVANDPDCASALNLAPAPSCGSIGFNSYLSNYCLYDSSSAYSVLVSVCYQ